MLAGAVTAPDASCPHQTVRSLLTAPDGSLSIHLLPTIAGRRSQRTFAHALFSYITRHLVPSASPLSTHARARLRHAAVPPSPIPFQAYYIPLASRLTDHAIQFLYCHRLGIPLPFLPSPLPHHCHPKCPYYPHHKGGFSAAHLPHLAHAYHQIACGATPRRHNRHDALARLIATAARTHLRATADPYKRLISSVTGPKTKVDLVITTYRQYPPTTAIDVTISCPLLPSHLSDAAARADALFETRAAEKNAKHLPGCVALERVFMPVVFSSLGGLGPPEAAHYLDSLFVDSYADELLRTGTTRHTAHLRTLFLQSLLASLASSAADMASALTSGAANQPATAPPAASPPAAAPPATAQPATGQPAAAQPAAVQPVALQPAALQNAFAAVLQPPAAPAAPPAGPQPPQPGS